MNKFITTCAKQAHKVILLTGTPLYNRTNDLVALYNMISNKGELVKPKEFKISMMKCKVSFRGASKEFFPKRVDIDEYIEMSPKYEELYDKCIDNVSKTPKENFFLDLYGGGNYEAFYNVIRRAVNNLEDQHSAKIQWILKKLKSLKPKQKTVVFSNYLDAGIRVIMKAMPSTITFGYIDGSIPMKVRKEIVQQYNDDKMSVLFISRAGGEGLDLKGTRNVIIMEPAWNQATEEQVVGRGIRYMSHAHLPKKDQTVNVYHLYHIRKTDAKALDKLKEWFQSLKSGKVQEVPIDPYTESFDVYMKYVIDSKQILINKFDKKLQTLSIEKKKC